MRKLPTILSLLSVLLISPFFINAGEKFVTINSPESGFEILQNDRTLTVSGTIKKSSWNNQVQRHGGSVTANIFVESVGQASLQISNVTSIRNKAGKIKSSKKIVRAFYLNLFL